MVLVDFRSFWWIPFDVVAFLELIRFSSLSISDKPTSLNEKLGTFFNVLVISKTLGWFLFFCYCFFNWVNFFSISIKYQFRSFHLFLLFHVVLNWSGLFSYASLMIAIACMAWWRRIEMLEIFAYCTVTVAHFTDQNWIPKTVYCIECVMVCKICFTNWNAKIALLRASIVVTYYIKLFQTGADRRNGILISLLLLVAETIS